MENGQNNFFSNPDFAQQKVRELALKEGKILIMATPRLKEGYLKIDSNNVKDNEEKASTIAGAFKYGKKLERLIKLHLIITACVAVDLKGHKLGKGKGYANREINILKNKFGNIAVLTTVDDFQIVKVVPFEAHDEKVNIIITPTKILRAN